MTGLLSLWWVWLAAALVLGLIELLAPAFIFLGFSIAAVIMAGLAAFGVLPTGPAAMFAVFAALALMAWIGLRVFFKSPTPNVKTFREDVNDN